MALADRRRPLEDHLDSMGSFPSPQPRHRSMRRLSLLHVVKAPSPDASQGGARFLWMQPPRKRVSVIALIFLCSGCSVLGPRHMFGDDGSYHPWHQVPGRAAWTATAAIMFSLTSPIWIAEGLMGLPSVMKEGRVGVSGAIIGAVSNTGGYIVAAPFFLIGLPFEFCEENCPAESGQDAPRKDIVLVLPR